MKFLPAKLMTMLCQMHFVVGCPKSESDICKAKKYVSVSKGVVKLHIANRKILTSEKNEGFRPKMESEGALTVSPDSVWNTAHTLFLYSHLPVTFLCSSPHVVVCQLCPIAYHPRCLPWGFVRLVEYQGVCLNCQKDPKHKEVVEAALEHKAVWDKVKVRDVRAWCVTSVEYNVMWISCGLAWP